MRMSKKFDRDMRIAVYDVIFDSVVSTRFGLN